jgi:hypothetical protein
MRLQLLLHPFGVLLGLGCGKGDVDTGGTAPVDESEPLELPDISGIVFADAVLASLSIDANTAWSGHVAALDARSDTCPDFYAGVPDVGLSELDLDEPGTSWYDYCAADTVDFAGLVYWETEVEVTGDSTSADGLTANASRLMSGDALLSSGGENWYEFDGEATDSLYRVSAKNYERWTWSSSVTATVTGELLFDASTTLPGGWRTDMYLYGTGGDADTLTMNGEVYLYGANDGVLLADRFDSMAMDLEFLGETGAGPEDCTLEPSGWIGVRDQNAWWYDLVFLPSTDSDGADTGYGNDPYGGCDGCGTLFIRGLEIVEVGTICPDLSGVWAALEARVPIADDYVLSLRELEAP